MPAGSQRTGASPYFQYSWKSSTAFSLDERPAVPGKRGQGQVVSYSLSPSFAWTATPRVVKFHFKRSGKEGAIFWSIT
jgi:hypothetical protein